MAKYTIDRGTTANDGTGDNLRAGANKVNLNFDEIYLAIGDGTTLGANFKVKDDSSTVATINTKGETLGILGGTGLSSTVSGSDVSLSVTGLAVGADVISGKVGGANFNNGILIGTTTTGTLNAAQDNIGIGTDSLRDITSADSNVAIGSNSGRGITSNGYNVFIGRNSGVSSSGTANVGLGPDSLQGASFSGGENMAIGFAAGEAISSGQRNVLIGKDAGKNITTGSGNIIFGTINADSATGDRQLKIAGNDGTTTTTWITGDSAGKVTIPGDLDVQGTQTTIDSATIQITNSFTFEGTTSDDKETILTVIDPTLDRTVSLPDATGTVVLKDTTDTLTNKTLTTPIIAEIDATGDLTLDAVGAINLDSTSNNIEFSSNGTGFLSLQNSSGDVWFRKTGQDTDFKFLGNDGGVTTTALILDMSDAGAAIFNGNITAGGTINSSTSGSKIRFDYANTGAFPNEVTYEGMFAYDIGGDNPYVADAGGWTKIITENASIGDLSNVNISGVADSYGLVWSSAQGRFNVATIPTAGFSIAMAVAL